MRHFEHNSAVFIDVVRVCDVITPEVNIKGQFRKRHQNGTMILYNLGPYSVCVQPKRTHIRAKILFKKRVL